MVSVTRSVVLSQAVARDERRGSHDASVQENDGTRLVLAAQPTMQSSSSCCAVRPDVSSSVRSDPRTFTRLHARTPSVPTSPHSPIILCHHQPITVSTSKFIYFIFLNFSRKRRCLRLPADDKGAKVEKVDGQEDGRIDCEEKEVRGGAEAGGRAT